MSLLVMLNASRGAIPSPSKTFLAAVSARASARPDRRDTVRRDQMKRLSFASVILVLFTTTVLAEKKDVTITAADGFALKGTLYSPGKNGPGVLLLHQCNADR